MATKDPQERIVSSTPQGLRTYLNPLSMAKSLWQARRVFLPLAKRQLAVRYRGSHLGMLWTLLNPLAMLAIYTFVFSIVMKNQWPGGSPDAHGEFALAVFSGLIPFNLLSESLQMAQNSVHSNRTYISKMVFPVEVLPMAPMGAALLQSLCSLAILIGGALWVFGGLHPTVFILPFLYLPLVLLCMGLGWFLAAVGAYVRDTSHILNIALLMLLFVTPIFYPVSVVPQAYAWVLRLNPLCPVVEWFRNAVLWGHMPGLWQYAILCLVSLVICQAGYAWFMTCKRDFADLV